MSSMATIEPGTESLLDSLSPAPYVLSRWYAAHTRARHEKRVAEQLGHRGIEHFLPLYERISRWKDRRVRLQAPLFDGYVFVRIALKDRLGVLEVPGVARLVSFNGHPAPLAESDIEVLREDCRPDIARSHIPICARVTASGSRAALSREWKESCSGRKTPCALFFLSSKSRARYPSRSTWKTLSRFPGGT